MPKTFGDIILFLKGAAIGAANVVPGVSGGTVAFLTGIYERLIDAIKSFDLKASKLLLKFQIKELFIKTDLKFLLIIAFGALISVLTLARLLEFLFREFQTPTWAFFFGLILASIAGVSKFIDKWSVTVVVSIVVGLIGAILLLFVPQSEGSASFLYLVLCGVAAISSMIIPGVSGSFVLLVMGNYQMILKAVVDIDLTVLFPFSIGCLIGIVSLSHLISWVFKNYKNVAIGVITGFIIGSLLLIWPWKEQKFDLNSKGDFAVKVDHGGVEYRSGNIDEVRQSLKFDEELIVVGYKDWSLPNLGELSSWYAIVCAILGCIIVIVIDRMGRVKSKENEIR